MGKTRVVIQKKLKFSLNRHRKNGPRDSRASSTLYRSHGPRSRLSSTLFSCILPETNVIYCRLTALRGKNCNNSLVVSYREREQCGEVIRSTITLFVMRSTFCLRSTVISTSAKRLIEIDEVQPRGGILFKNSKARMSLQGIQNLLFKNNAVN